MAAIGLRETRHKVRLLALCAAVGQSMRCCIGGLLEAVLTPSSLAMQPDELFKIASVMGTPTAATWPEGLQLAQQVGPPRLQAGWLWQTSGWVVAVCVLPADLTCKTHANHLPIP